MKKATKICFIIFVVLFGFILIWLQFPSLLPPFQYLLFTHRSNGYYVRVASACNLILDKHPVTSSNTVTWSPEITVKYTIKIPGDDHSLPTIIRRLNPEFVLVGTNHVTVSIPPERMGGFGIVWTQLDPQTNHWVLQAGGDVLATVCSQ